METRDTVTVKDAEVLLGTLVAAERLAWDDEAIREFQRRRAEEAERRRKAKLPVTQRGSGRPMRLTAC